MTRTIFNTPQITIANDDCFNYIKTLDENSVDLIILDPPYYKTLEVEWDNQWKSLADYLAWLDSFFAECFRVLRPQGSIYCFCSDRYTAEIELLIKKRFNFLNHITWKKTSGRFKAHNKERLRSYATASERIMFAEHYNADGFCKGQAGYNIKIDELKAQAFKPLIENFINAKNILGIKAKDIHKATNTYMYKHWFSFSQWELPSVARFEQLYKYFDEVAAQKGLNNPFNTGYNALSKEYQTIKEQYNELKQQYDNLRRCFNISKHVPYTDVWEYSPVQFYPGKHPCEKPKPMIDDIIKASSRKGDTIADFFIGSGRTPLSCIELDRKFVGCELDKNHYKGIIKKVEEQL